MAFPFIVQETFDDGTRGNFDSGAASPARLDFPSYKELARFGLSPFQGSHALRLRIDGAVGDSIREDTSFDTALGGTLAIWLPVCIAADFTLSDGNAVILLALQSAGAVNEVVFGVRRSGDNYQLFAGETGATRTLTITRSNSKWHQVELVITLDNGVDNNGTIDFYVDGGQVGAQITGLDQAAIATAELGTVSGLAAGNTGTVLIGGIIADDLRVFPRKRFPQDTVWITRDQVAYVGSGTLDGVELTGTSTDAVLSILDTDIYEASLTNFSREPLVYVRNVSANEIVPGLTVPKTFHKGLYVQLTGTSPQAWLSIGSGSSVVLSHSNYVDRARK